MGGMRLFLPQFLLLQGLEAGAKKGGGVSLSLSCILTLGVGRQGNFPSRVRQSQDPSRTTSVALVVYRILG